MSSEAERAGNEKMNDFLRRRGRRQAPAPGGQARPGHAQAVAEEGHYLGLIDPDAAAVLLEARGDVDFSNRTLLARELHGLVRSHPGLSSREGMHADVDAGVKGGPVAESHVDTSAFMNAAIRHAAQERKLTHGPWNPDELRQAAAKTAAGHSPIPPP